MYVFASNKKINLSFKKMYLSHRAHAAPDVAARAHGHAYQEGHNTGVSTHTPPHSRSRLPHSSPFPLLPINTAQTSPHTSKSY